MAIDTVVMMVGRKVGRRVDLLEVCLDDSEVELLDVNEVDLKGEAQKAVLSDILLAIEEVV